MNRNKLSKSAVTISTSEISDEDYLGIFTSPLAVCRRYKPKFGKGGAGINLAEFRRMYGEDPFYSWIGMDSPLMYAAHKVAGGMTSIYRQLGIGGERLFNKILQDRLGLTAKQAAWTYKIPIADKKDRSLYLDGRIEYEDIAARNTRKRVMAWGTHVADVLLLEKEPRKFIKGVVFEVRQGYKSKDSKRQNADISNAVSAYANLYMPVLFLLSTQIDRDIAVRYQQARWLLLTGSASGTDIDSSYVFCRDILQYDLADFFKRNSLHIKTKLEEVLTTLLSA